MVTPDRRNSGGVIRMEYLLAPVLKSSWSESN
jgi:hypothetical protein